MKASDLPSFLYPHGTMYDEENLDSGLFRGHVLIRVCFFFWISWILTGSYCVIQGLQLIYTGNSSVLTGHRAASKPSKAKKYSMREVTPESMAYIVTQGSLFPPFSIILAFFLLFRYILVCAALNHGAQMMATSTLSNFIMFV